MEVTKKELKQMYYDMVTIRYAVLVLQTNTGCYLKPSILMV